MSSYSHLCRLLALTLAPLSTAASCAGSQNLAASPPASSSATGPAGPDASTERHAPAEQQTSGGSHQTGEGATEEGADAANAQGERLASRLFAKYAESPCWRAEIRQFTSLHRSAGVFYKSPPDQLLWLMEGREPAKYSLLNDATFTQLFFLAEQRKGDFWYRARFFAPPRSTRSFEFSAILEAFPIHEEDVRMLGVTLYLDDDLTVLAARIRLDAHGRESVTRFLDWQSECPAPSKAPSSRD